MKIFLPLMAFVLALAGCSKLDDDATTLRSMKYTMYRANYNPVSGVITVTEKAAGKLEFKIELENTDPNSVHTAHLHFGSVREVGDLAFRLNDVDGESGKSITVMDNVVLSNGDTLTYDNFLTMDGSVKVHMSETYFTNMVLSFGNVGANEDIFYTGVATCTGH